MYFLSTINFACNSKNKDEGSQSSTFDNSKIKEVLFLTQEELDAKNTVNIEENQLASKVNDVIQLYDEKPDDESAEDEAAPVDQPFLDCINAAIKGTVTVDKNTVTLSIDSPEFTCTTSEKAKYIFFKYKTVSRGQCEELSEFGKSLDKKNPAEALELKGKACVEGKEVRSVFQSHLKYDASSESEGKTVKLSSDIKSSSLATDKEPCLEKDGVQSNCKTVDVISRMTTFDGGTASGTERTVTISDNIKNENGDKVFFAAGKMSLELADWTGQIVYTAANVAPKWTLKKGDVTKNGTLTQKETSFVSKDQELNAQQFAGKYLQPTRLLKTVREQFEIF